MTGSATQATLGTLVSITDAEPTRASRVLQNSILTELPGAAFAVITLVYVVLSLATLQGRRREMGEDMAFITQVRRVPVAAIITLARITFYSAPLFFAW
jgi:hypothetical protein